MTKEEKNLLIADLCGRLPYGVKVRVAPVPSVECAHLFFNAKVTNIDVDYVGVLAENGWLLTQDITEIRPYLFPLSSMTEEQEDEWYRLHVQPLFDRLGVKDRKEDLILQAKSLYIGVDWLIANHFDYRGLIPMGLAIDCTNLNVY